MFCPAERSNASVWRTLFYLMSVLMSLDRRWVSQGFFTIFRNSVSSTNVRALYRPTSRD